MTDLDVYQPAAGELSQLAMTPDQAKALDDQVRLCTEAVLREGTDYGHIPGTNGEEKSLWRPGAQKLLQWFRLECICERVEVERGDDGRKHGITYRAEVGRGLKTATPVILATCEGTADYDETKFYQTAEQVQRRAEDRERINAEKYRRVPRPTKWQGLPEYRADWNALMKRAQKRAIVGAVNDATAAGGIFTDREEDDHAPPPDDDTPPPEQRRNPAAGRQDGDTLFQRLLTEAATLKTDAAAARITRQAQTAAKKNEITLEQEGRVQDRVQRTLTRLHETAEPVDVEDLADQALDEPGSVTAAQLTKLHAVLTGLGFGGEDREQKLVIAEAITGRAPLTGPATQGRSTKNLSLTEAGKLIDTLDGFKDRVALIAYMAEHEDRVRQETIDE